MHGMAIADDIIQQAERLQKESGGKRVREIHLKVGRFMFSDLSELTEAFKFLAKDSPVKKAEIKVEYIDGHNCIFDKVVFEEEGGVDGT